MSETLKNLKCCVCGESCRGLQWRNRDIGYGVCEPCGTQEMERQGEEDAEKCYGFKRIHWGINENHTLGPWKWQSPTWINDKEFEEESLVGKDGLVIFGSCSAADGRLIASAPDLLCALQTMVKILEEARNPENFWKAMDFATTQARAAIKKATQP